MHLDNTKYVEIFCTIKHRTERAVLINDGTRDAWIPKSQIEDEDEQPNGAMMLLIPEWLALEKGLI